MRPDALEGLLAWLDEVTESLDGHGGGTSERLKKALADVAERLEERLDDAASSPDVEAGRADAAGGSSSHSSSSSHASMVAVDGPIPKAAVAASTGSVVGDSTGESSKPVKVGVTIRANEGQTPGDVDFKMSAKALAVDGKASDVTVSSQVQSTSGRPEKLDVKVAVGDWDKNPGDGDLLDFLLVLGRGSTDAPAITKAERKDVDLVLNVNLKGMALKSQVKAEGLKPVKIVDKNGVEKTGWLGQADADGSVVKVVLKPAGGGGTVGVLALDIQATGHGGPSFPFPDFPF